MQWFKRHLNWTYVLGTVVLPFGVVLPLLAYWQATNILSYVGPGATSFILIFSLLVGVVAIVVSLIVPIWVLKQKGRSLWWYWSFPWVVLLLKNRR